MSALWPRLAFRKPIDFGTFLALFILLIECLRYAFATNTHPRWSTEKRKLQVECQSQGAKEGAA